MPEPGRLLARGRAADVFEYGTGLVLRRYRTEHDCLYEGAVMQHVRSHGYPAPDVIQVAGPDIVMERVEGPTMLDDFARRPWKLYAHADELARLLERLHAIPPPVWLRPKLELDGEAIVHLDLHPLNVIMSPDGPVVIDWTNAGRCAPEAELADLWLVMANATPESRMQRILTTIGRRLFVRRVLKHFERDAVRRYLAVAAEHRLADRNMRDVERVKIRRFVERWGL